MTQHRLTIECVNPVQAHAAMMAQVWPMLKAMTLEGHKMTLELRKTKRSDALNRVMWSRLGDVARDVEWYGRKLTPTDWKMVFTASLAKMDVVPNLEGTGFVALGMSTSQMSNAQIMDINELAMSFGTERGVNWCVASLCGDVDPPDTLPPVKGRAKMVDQETGEIA